MKVEIITIGDEILQGQIVDTNSAWIAKELLALYVPVQHIATIADRKEAIVEALTQAELRADFILVTGGLGPTKDDITKQTAAAYFGTALIRDQAVLEHVKGIFRRFDRDMPLINEMQADVFADGEVLFNEYGTAPGLLIEKRSKTFVFLPGVPFEMKHLISTYIIPRLSSAPTKEKILNQYILTAGIGESHLAEQIKDIEAALPEHIRLAYLPRLGLVRLRLTGWGADEGKLQGELQQFSQRIGERLHEYLVSYENIEFEQALIQKLQEKNLMMGTAESCTGGSIAHRITEIPGSSAVFQGGIVAYANEVKENILGVDGAALQQFGAVSEEVVKQMAEGAVRVLGVDFAVATSGIAGPGGSTPEKPVGLIWIAVASRTGVYARKFQFNNDRLVNIERTTTQGLLMLWNAVKKA